MDTLTKSCSPTIVITANGEVQTHEEAIVYVKELDIFLTMKVLDNTPAVLSLRRALRWKRVFLRMDQWSKTTSHLKTGFGYNATRRTSFLSWFQACQVRPLDLHQLYGHLWNRRVIPHHLLHPHLLHLQQAKFRFENEKMWLTVTSLQCQCLSWLMIDQGNLRKSKPTESQNQIKRKPRWDGEASVVILRSRNGC